MLFSRIASYISEKFSTKKLLFWLSITVASSIVGFYVSKSLTPTKAILRPADLSASTIFMNQLPANIFGSGSENTDFGFYIANTSTANWHSMTLKAYGGLYLNPKEADYDFGGQSYLSLGTIPLSMAIIPGENKYLVITDLVSKLFLVTYEFNDTIGADIKELLLHPISYPHKHKSTVYDYKSAYFSTRMIQEVPKSNRFTPIKELQLVNKTINAAPILKGETSSFMRLIILIDGYIQETKFTKILLLHYGWAADPNFIKFRAGNYVKNKDNNNVNNILDFAFISSINDTGLDLFRAEENWQTIATKNTFLSGFVPSVSAMNSKFSAANFDFKLNASVGRVWDTKGTATDFHIIYPTGSDIVNRIVPATDNPDLNISLKFSRNIKKITFTNDIAADSSDFATNQSKQ